MKYPRCTFGQHIAAVLTVVVLSLALTGLVDVVNQQFDFSAGLEAPRAQDLGGITAPSDAGWGRAVLSIGGMR